MPMDGFHMLNEDLVALPATEMRRLHLADIAVYPGLGLVALWRVESVERAHRLRREKREERDDDNDPRVVEALHG